ncbi:MAG: tetratricopeptide repeat protein [Rhodospirillales bacterium]|nr:tetratricopeptide repeat protein [Rhodospirillales bacterium]
MTNTRSARWIYKVTTAVGLSLFVGACSSTSSSPPGGMSAEATKVEKQDQHSGMLLRYCNKLYEAKDLYVAASMCRRAYDVNPTDPAPLYTLADIYDDMGATESKANAYRLALQIDPDDVEALYGLGKTSIDMGRYDLAVAQLERAIQLDPTDARFYNAMGVAKDQLLEHETAQMLYREGLAIDPDNVSLRNNLGLSLTLSGNHKESVAMLRDVAREPGAGTVGSRNLALAATNAAKPQPNMAMEDADGAPTGLLSADAESGMEQEMQTAMAKDEWKVDFPSKDRPLPASLFAAMSKPMTKAKDQELAQNMSQDKEKSDGVAVASVDDSMDQAQIGSLGSANVSMDAEPGSEAATADAGARMPTGIFASDRMSDDKDSTVPSPEEIRGSMAETGNAHKASGPKVVTAPAQAPATASAASAASGETSYTVQVGSYTSEEGAKRGWGIISEAAKDILKDVPHSIVAADLGGEKGTVYRLRAGEMADKASANQLCADLSDKDVGCFVVRLPEAAPAPAAQATPNEPMAEKSQG